MKGDRSSLAHRLQARRCHGHIRFFQFFLELLRYSSLVWSVTVESVGNELKFFKSKFSNIIKCYYGKIEILSHWEFFTTYHTAPEWTLGYWLAPNLILFSRPPEWTPPSGHRSSWRDTQNKLLKIFYSY